MNTITLEPVIAPAFDFDNVTVTDDEHEPSDGHNVCHLLDAAATPLCGRRVAGYAYGVPAHMGYQHTSNGQCTACRKRRCSECMGQYA